MMKVANGEAFSRESLPRVPVSDFRELLIKAVRHGRRVASLFGYVDEGDARVLVAVLAADDEARLELISTHIQDNSFVSMTPQCPQVHLFEREIYEQWGVTPQGHPWLKPVRFQAPLGNRPSPTQPPQCGVTDYFRVEGEEIHEVAVGPVHAGVIEPGHFRFQCHGEHVFHLEVSLGYQHRGVERAVLGGPTNKTLHLFETVAGDSTVAHATAYCLVLESLAAARPSARAEAIRAVALELERLANHTGDLGALAGDVGFLPTANYCGRLRGDFLNITALICGNRFGRGIVRPAGVGFDLDAERATLARERLDATYRDVKGAVALLWKTPSVQARFEDIGKVSVEIATELGLVGLAARACGLKRDNRKNHPWGIYRFSHIPLSTGTTGDVHARAFVRWLEIERSVAFVRRQLGELPVGEVERPCGRPRPNMGCVSLVEGWRGEVCHVAMTDQQGAFDVYKIVDPSFHNWSALAMALRDQQISDFPVCNKSFNLSYCGFDL